MPWNTNMNNSQFKHHWCVSRLHLHHTGLSMSPPQKLFPSTHLDGWVYGDHVIGPTCNYTSHFCHSHFPPEYTQPARHCSSLIRTSYLGVSPGTLSHGDHSFFRIYWGNPYADICILPKGACSPYESPMFLLKGELWISSLIKLLFWPGIGPWKRPL